MPQLQVIKHIPNAITGEITSSKAIGNMKLDFKLKRDRIMVDRLVLYGDEFAAYAKGGYVRFDGRLKMILAPADPGSVLHDVLGWMPGTGSHVSGTLQDPRISNLPPIFSLRWLRRWLTPGDLDEE